MNHCTLVLKQIRYAGDNIGRDLVFTFNTGFSRTVVRKRITQGTVAELDEEILSLAPTSGDPVDLAFDLDIQELDRRRNDETRQPVMVRIDPAGPAVQPLHLSARVEDAPRWGRARVAEFDLELEARCNGIEMGSGLRPDDRDVESPLLAVVGDLRLGADPESDAFGPEDEALWDDVMTGLEENEGTLELLLLGNLMDLWMSREHLPASASEAEAAAITRSKIGRIVARHRRVFDRLAGFGGEIIYVPGSRDSDVLLPGVADHLARSAGVSFRIQRSYDQGELQLAAEPVHAHILPGNPAATGAKPYFRTLFEEFANTLSALAGNGWPLPVHFDSFDPPAQYRLYAEALRQAAGLTTLLSDQEAKAIASYIRSQPEGPILDRNTLDRLADFALAQADRDLLEDAGFLGQLYDFLGQDLVDANRAAAIERAATGNRGRAILLGQGASLAFNRLPGGALSVDVGRWQRRYRFDPSRPAEPTALPGQYVTLVYRQGGHPRQGRVRIFSMPGAALAGSAGYRIS